MNRPRAEALGDRVRRFRKEKNLTLTQLANASGVSKGYLSSIENEPQDRRPSAQSLYAIAHALGVAMSDLLGEKLIIESGVDIPPSLRAFADDAKLPIADVQMLASIQFRGDRPQTKERWRHIYEAIRMSTTMDTPNRAAPRS